jgi:hypothetical protein
MDIIKNLSLLNSKERFYLFTYATNKGKFELTDEFKNEIYKTIKVKMPNNYFAAIDYHLDWLSAAITKDSDVEEAFKNGTEFDNSEGLITGNQEDIDLIIAFEEDSEVTIIMIEAKGVGSWTTKQVSSKKRRLDEIFKKSNERNIYPYLILMSPKESEGLKRKIDIINNRWIDKETNNYYWIKLKLPSPLYKVGRVGKDEQNRKKWRIGNR